MTREEIASILQKLRCASGYTQKQVAEKIGKKQQTVASWETGQSQPDADTLFTLCDIYGTTVNNAFGFSDTENYSAFEKSIIKKYRALDGHGKKMVDYALEEETLRMEQELTRAAEEPVDEEVEMIVYDDAAAAGHPLYAESDYERISFPASQIPYGANFGVRISGHSMEPTIEDGSIVWVRKQESLENGDIGIFSLDDGAVCKRYVETGVKIELRSDNPDYDNITGYNLSGLHCWGKVLL